MSLDFTGVFDQFAIPIVVWETVSERTELGTSQSLELEGSRRTVFALVNTETDLRAQNEMTGDHLIGTIDVHVLNDRLYISEKDNGKQSYLSFDDYTWRVQDTVMNNPNATHRSYRAVRYNDAGNDRY